MVLEGMTPVGERERTGENGRKHDCLDGNRLLTRGATFRKKIFQRNPKCTSSIRTCLFF